MPPSLAKDIASGRCQIGVSVAMLSGSVLKGAFTRFRESPRSLLNPMASFTRAFICPISASVKATGTAAAAGFASLGSAFASAAGAAAGTGRLWFTRMAADRRFTLPTWARVWRTVLSTS